MKKQNVVILGAGFIGGHLLRRLAGSSQFRLKVLAHGSAHGWIADHENITVFQGDVCDRGILDRIIQKGDVVINLTGQISESRLDFLLVNLCGVSNLANACREKKIKKLIHISSILVYGDLSYTAKKSFSETDKPNPTNEYSEVKNFTEKILGAFSIESRTKLIILRLANVYGQFGKGIINKIMDSVSKDAEIALNNVGNLTRDFIYVDDVASAIMRAINYESKQGIEIFNISNNIGIALSEIFDYLRKKGKNLKVRYKSAAHSEDLKNIANNTKARKMLGFKPKIDFLSGMDSLLNQI